MNTKTGSVAKHQAFTLLEMLIAMLILSTIISSVYAAFHAGVLASRRMLKEDTGRQNLLGRLNLMASEIRNAVYMNDVLIAGTAIEMYFYAPMKLKQPSDVLPLYRVRYWFDRTGTDNGTLYRSVVPWIALQKPGMSPEEISRAENTQPWIGPVQDLRFEYAMKKKRGSVSVLQENGQLQTEGTRVDGNPDLVWKNDYDAKSETPFGIRMKWEDPGGHDSALFWPALGLYQSTTPNINVAPVSGVTTATEMPRPTEPSRS